MDKEKIEKVRIGVEKKIKVVFVVTIFEVIQ